MYPVSWLPSRLRGAFVLMCAETVSLAVVSPLHLAGLLQGGLGAGAAEAVICAALAWGAVSVLRSTPRWRAVALGTTAFAIVGFAYGLSVTSQGGTLPDVAYHSAVLPLLLVTFGLIASTDPRSAGPATIVPSASDDRA
ncbi:MAG: hypothetical protein ACYDEY_16175 [Acidimicrobiales bacterium]